MLYCSVRFIRRIYGNFNLDGVSSKCEIRFSINYMYFVRNPKINEVLINWDYLTKFGLVKIAVIGSFGELVIGGCLKFDLYSPYIFF